jgi:SAM-dependent methyltransferase
MQEYSLERSAEYWDNVADRYLELFRDEFKSKPYDIEALRSFAASLPHGARVCDAGCGPCGHVTRILADHGLRVVGIDLSPRCIELARREQPGPEFRVMDLARMDFADGRFDGLVAYYAFHYQPKATLTAVFRELARVVRPGGRILVVAKEGDGEGWIDDPLGSSQTVFWSSFRQAELESLLAENRFTELQCALRAPLPGEAQVRRIYLTGVRCAAGEPIG